VAVGHDDQQIRAGPPGARAPGGLASDPRSVHAYLVVVAKPAPSLDDLVAQLDALPADVRGEIIQGTLYTNPRPLPRHMRIEGLVVDDLTSPYQRGRGGPGGWWILPESGICLAGSPEFSPDVAGWRRERLPALPDGKITIAPDWLCEIHSTKTRGYDLRVKRPFYAEIAVEWLWYVDVDARTLTVSRLQGGRWLEVGVPGDQDKVRAAPFDAVEIDLAEWWGDAPP
jgi:Uma2 family endonuclease